MKLHDILLESEEQQLAAQLKAALDKEMEDGELNIKILEMPDIKLDY